MSELKLPLPPVKVLGQGGFRRSSYFVVTPNSLRLYDTPKAKFPLIEIHAGTSPEAAMLRDALLKAVGVLMLGGV